MSDLQHLNIAVAQITELLQVKKDVLKVLFQKGIQCFSFLDNDAVMTTKYKKVFNCSQHLPSFSGVAITTYLETSSDWIQHREFHDMSFFS